MAVAAQIGGATPDFDRLYAEVARISKKLAVASPREFQDPGQKLKLTVVTDPGQATESRQEFETYIKAFYDKQGDPITYKLYYKDGQNNEVEISDGTTINGNVNSTGPGAGTTDFILNGITLSGGQTLQLDQSSGRIIYDDGGGPQNLGLLKLDAVSGLDVALVNDRISQVNLVIEALNKVLLVGNNNADKGIELRI